VNKIKNIAIIAHVDHGKTTLVDAMLRQTGVFRENQQVADRIMDSNDLEREKGITIFSKNASVVYKNYRINLVDTPGHADFGGEVQRILKMVDSVLLLVDASEGPMPQTKYVLKKSLELGLHPLVVVNKIDRPNARPNEVSGEVFDLFCDLGAQESQIDFPLVFASARDGYAVKELEDEKKSLEPLFEAILTHVPDASGDREHPFQLLVAATSYDNYVGMIGTGKIHSGIMKAGMEVACVAPGGEKVFEKITQLYTYTGMKRISIEEARAGDIVSFAGVSNVEVGKTIADKEYPHPLPTIEIDEPTISMTFLVNNSPFSGREGSFVTSRQLWERLEKEGRGNVSMRVERTASPDAFTVKGRGELQMAILIENMRREGYEFQVSKPEVIIKEIDGIRMEPYERATIDVGDEYAGAVIEMMGMRKGEMVHMVQGKDGYTRLEYIIPARGLIGFLNEFMTLSRGTGILNHTFHSYDEWKGEISRRSRGSLIAFEGGVSVAYAIDSFQDRGVFFIGAGVPVYEGMVVGEHNKDQDLMVNVCKTKKLTNVRAAGSDDAVKLSPPRDFSLEQALEYIADDELLEVTPKSMRMRKKILDKHDRKRSEKR